MSLKIQGLKASSTRSNDKRGVENAIEKEYRNDYYIKSGHHITPFVLISVCCHGRLFRVNISLNK